MSKKTKIELLTDFMTGINRMMGATDQLVQQRQNPKFMAIRDQLNMIRDSISKYIKDSGIR